MQLRRLNLHQSRGAAKACWFSVEPRSVLKKIHVCRVKSVKNEKCQFAHRRPILTSREKRERLFSDMLLFICGSVYGGGPSAMERFSFANEAGKKR